MTTTINSIGSEIKEKKLMKALLFEKDLPSFKIFMKAIILLNLLVTMITLDSFYSVLLEITNSHFLLILLSIYRQR